MSILHNFSSGTVVYGLLREEPVQNKKRGCCSPTEGCPQDLTCSTVCEIVAVAALQPRACQIYTNKALCLFRVRVLRVAGQHTNTSAVCLIELSGVFPMPLSRLTFDLTSLFASRASPSRSFPPHRPLANVSSDWILSTNLFHHMKAYISLIRRQKTVLITRRRSCHDLCPCPRNPSHFHHGTWFKPSFTQSSYIYA
jgi:hypothetical protein